MLIFFTKYGLGEPAPIHSLIDQFDGSKSLIWADGTNGTSNPSPSDIIARITSNFTSTQLAGVRRVSNLSDISSSCPQNFNALSSCFAGLGFTDIPSVDVAGAPPVNYTIFADAGLSSIDVEHHTSDFERRIFPLQWAVDQVRLISSCLLYRGFLTVSQAIIELQTGISQQTPLEWPYTNITNAEQETNIRLSESVYPMFPISFRLNILEVTSEVLGR